MAIHVFTWNLHLHGGAAASQFKFHKSYYHSAFISADCRCCFSRVFRSCFPGFTFSNSVTNLHLSSYRLLAFSSLTTNSFLHKRKIFLWWSFIYLFYLHNPVILDVIYRLVCASRCHVFGKLFAEPTNRRNATNRRAITK